MVKLFVGLGILAFGAVGMGVAAFRERPRRKPGRSKLLSQSFAFGGLAAFVVGFVVIMTALPSLVAGPFDASTRQQLKREAITQAGPMLFDLGYRGAADRNLTDAGLYEFNNTVTNADVQIKMQQGWMGHVHLRKTADGWQPGCFVRKEFTPFDTKEAVRLLTATKGCEDFRTNAEM